MNQNTRFKILEILVIGPWMADISVSISPLKKHIS